MKDYQYWQRNNDLPGYNDWVDSHICPINHKGSSGAMETSGALQIYCDDGDSKSYQDIVSKNIYPGYKIEKNESCTKKSWITFALT